MPLCTIENTYNYFYSGTRYAMMAMKAQLSIILQKYKIKAKHTIQDVKLKADLMLKPVDGHLVKLELRNPGNI